MIIVAKTGEVCTFMTFNTSTNEPAREGRIRKTFSHQALESEDNATRISGHSRSTTITSLETSSSQECVDNVHYIGTLSTISPM